MSIDSMLIRTVTPGLDRVTGFCWKRKGDGEFVNFKYSNIQKY